MHTSIFSPASPGPRSIGRFPAGLFPAITGLGLALLRQWKEAVLLVFLLILLRILAWPCPTHPAAGYQARHSNRAAREELLESLLRPIRAIDIAALGRPGQEEEAGVGS
jgi:hypothetical protein